MKDFRCLLGYPFGVVAEIFARLALYISDGELDVDFNYIEKLKKH